MPELRCVHVPELRIRKIGVENILFIVACCPVWEYMNRDNRVTGWMTSILHRMGVVLMDKKPFDFKDLMAFGMFILALLTFVSANLK